MKKLLFIFVSVLTALSAFAQDYEPTANWPYLYPDFKEGVMMVGNKPSKARFNIHLNLGALHYVDKGTIKESAALHLPRVPYQELYISRHPS